VKLRIIYANGIKLIEWLHSGVELSGIFVFGLLYYSDILGKMSDKGIGAFFLNRVGRVPLYLKWCNWSF
jgi:hypothetical protein